MREFIASLLVGLIVVALSAGLARAEDFSVHLDRYAEIDAERAMPEYTMDKVLKAADGNPEGDMPEKSYDVFMRFKKFGDVRLDEAHEAGPSTGKLWRKGMTFASGLSDLAGVKAGWIKDAPDLFIVVWEVDPDMRGTGHDFHHGYVILRLHDRSADVLMSGRLSLNGRVRGGSTQGVRFAFDRPRGHLLRQIRRWTWNTFDAKKPLAYPVQDESGDTVFILNVNEKVDMRYRYADGKIAPVAATLTYEASDNDTLSEVVAFYRSMSRLEVAREAILAANPDLARRRTGTAVDEPIRLPAHAEIVIPVRKEALEEFCRLCQ